MSSEIDIDSYDDENESNEAVDESLKEIDQIEKKQKNNKLTTKRLLKVRRAIEDHLDEQRFRKAIDYLDDVKLNDE
jgi:hypothetical protein